MEEESKQTEDNKGDVELQTKLNPTNFEQILQTIPHIELQLTRTIADSVQENILIKAKGYTQEEAVKSFNHAIAAIPEIKKRMDYKEKK